MLNVANIVVGSSNRALRGFLISRPHVDQSPVCRIDARINNENTE